MTFGRLWLLLQLARWRGQDGLIGFVTGLAADDPGLDPDVLAAARTHDPRVLYQALRRIPDQGAVDPAALSVIDTPTLVAAWDDDPVIHPIAVARDIAAAIPGARFARLDNLATANPADIAAVLTASVLRWHGALL
jgi:hypothetical protein